MYVCIRLTIPKYVCMRILLRIFEHNIYIVNELKLGKQRNT